jgi:hypothetical protein
MTAPTPALQNNGPGFRLFERRQGTAKLSCCLNARPGSDRGRSRDGIAALDFPHDVAVVQTCQADDGQGGSTTGQSRIELAHGGDTIFPLDLHRFAPLNRGEASVRLGP